VVVFLYIGRGAGKTTNALGLALRCVGHGLKVIVIQFMKGRKDIGEYKIRERLAPEYEIYQFGRPEFVDLENPSEEDRDLARKGLLFARECLKRRPHLLVLDELALACYVGLVSTEEVLKLLDEVPEGTDVVITGRYAPPELIDRADVVNMIVEVKYPRETYNRIGINW